MVSLKRYVLLKTKTANQEDTDLLNLTANKISLMHIKKPITEKLMVEESWLTTKKVFNFIIQGRTILRWRPRRFGQGAGDSRMTK